MSENLKPEESYNLKLGQSYGVTHLKSDRETPLLQFLTEEISGLSVEDATSLVGLGAVYLDGQRTLDASTPVKSGSYLRVHTNPRRYLCDLNELRSRVILSDQDWLVVDKPHGLPCHPLVDNLNENALTQFSIIEGKSLFITHRLDTVTGGLLVFAKNIGAQNLFNTALRNGVVTKIYQARCRGSGVDALKTMIGEMLIHYMKPSGVSPKLLCNTPKPGYQECALKILDATSVHDQMTEVKVQLLTGRTHQIRAQLAAVGAPIVGDTLYGGSKDQSPLSGISLKAVQIKWSGFEVSL